MQLLKDFISTSIDKINDACAAMYSIATNARNIFAIDIASANRDYSSISILQDTILLTGALAENTTIILGVSVRQYTVINNCTGSYFILLKTSTGTGITLYPGDVWVLYCDGANILPLWWNENIQLGVERLSSERWEGNPVYWKLIDTGALPNTNAKPTAHGISGTFTVVSLSGLAWDTSGVVIPLIGLAFYASAERHIILDSDRTNVYTRTNANLPAMSKSRVLLKYVKAAL